MLYKNRTALIVVLMVLVSLLLSSVKIYGADQEDPEIYGTVEYGSTFTDGSTLTDSFYYSDDWFTEDPTVRNDALGLVSMQLIAAAVENDENGKGIAFLKKLGFAETGLGGFQEKDPEGCNYTWGIKAIETGGEAFSLVAIVIQSHSEEQEEKQIGWRQNFLVNGEALTVDHASYAAAAERVLPWINSLDLSGNVKYWIMGQSRGGAIAGILAVRLKDTADSVYAYTFESPGNTDLSAVPDNAQDYGYIHNYICSDDIVTMIPPWSMGRYGVEHRLNTEETTLQLPSMLDRLGSDAVSLTEGYDTEDIENYSTSLIQALVSRIPSREDYSSLQTDVFHDASGNEVEITYKWQEELAGLMGIVFGNVLEGLDMDSLMDNLPEILPSLSSLYKAVKEDTDSDYYEAACGLCAFLENAGLELPLERKDIYVLLKLIGPVILNTEFVPASDLITQDELLDCITPGFTLYIKRIHLVFSHQFDTIIARLKVLAPEPEMENIDVVMEEPLPGDEAASCSVKAQEAFTASGDAWMDVYAEWNTEDTQFLNDKVYFLTVTLTTVGHSIPEGLTVTINGKEPEEPLKIAFEKGVTTIQGNWKYVLGSPEQVAVSFDMEGHGADPEPVYTQAGSRLKFTLSPDVPEIISDREGTFEFAGWYDENGLSREDVYAEKDLTLHAKWNRLIDDIEINCVIPRAGEELVMPEIPDGAPYQITKVSLLDEEWDEVTVADTGEMLLAIFVQPVSEEIQFQIATSEDGDKQYIGTMSLNGEEMEAWYDSYDNSVSISYSFTPLPAQQ